MDYNRANEDLYATLYLLVKLPTALYLQKYEDESEISGDKEAAFKELCGNYDRVTDEVIRATMEELVNTPMKPGQNPDCYFNKKRLLRIRIEKMGENISDRWFKGICVMGFTDEYKNEKMMVYRDSSFDIDQMQTTMRHMFLDQQSRKRTKGRIAGRGTAMRNKTLTNHDVYCFKCKERGHTKRKCTKFKPRTKPDGAAEWCSVHRTTSHSDQECYSQGETRPNKKASVSLACASCAHCSSGNNKFTTDTTATAKDNESPDSEKPVINFAGSNNDFDVGFMFTSAATRRFTPSTKGATLLVDGGASESFLGDELTPGLKERMREFRELSTPKEITTAGKHTIHGVGTGIISFTIRDSHGAQLPVNLRALVVPGFGRNIFTPTAELKNGVRFVLEVGNPHLTIEGIIIPLKQDPRDQEMCSLDIMFKRDPQDELLGKLERVSHDDAPGVVYAATADANIWHQRLGRMNPRSMELLRRKEENGMEYTGTVSDCDICALSKSRQRVNPKKSTRTATRPMKLIYTGLMGPFTPPAKEEYRYVSKFTDDYSRMKEVYLLRNKFEAAESLHQYNMTVAVPLGLRIEIVRCDKGGEYIGKEFKTPCVNAGINVEHTATNTPQQNGFLRGMDRHCPRSPDA